MIIVKCKKYNLTIKNVSFTHFYYILKNSSSFYLPIFALKNRRSANCLLSNTIIFSGSGMRVLPVWGDRGGGAGIKIPVWGDRHQNLIS